MQTNPKISIIVAVSRNRAIGMKNRLLFDLPDDLKRFKRITRSHTIVMGQRTFESIGRPLPERTNVVITDNTNYQAPGATVVHSIDEAVTKAHETEKSGEVFIIGGGMIYKQFLSRADKLYLTLVDSDAEGDTFFPDWRQDFTKETFREEHTDEKTGLKYAWINLERE